MPPPQVSIIGGGLSGLVLGRCLLHRGIPNTIFERDSFRASSARYNYGMTLHSSSYNPLLEQLGLDEQTFRRRLAVDSPVGGVGRLHDNKKDDAEFRANRQRLEQLLKEGLDVRWGHRLASFETKAGSRTLHFDVGQEAGVSLIVDAEGPHSHMRKTISPRTDLTVLPYAVYNGKRRISAEDFNAHYASHLGHATAIERRAGQTLLQVSINDRTDSEVSISYTYSRPARKYDAIFTPNRPNSGARNIPEALFDEVSTLSNLEGAFKEVFDAERMRRDRVLNWLMRSVAVDIDDLNAAARQGIVMIGDAVHATPILSGNGANAAIRDGIELAEFIADYGTRDLGKFYKGRHERWRRDVEESERRLAEMHEVLKASL